MDVRLATRASVCLLLRWVAKVNSADIQNPRADRRVDYAPAKNVDASIRGGGRIRMNKDG